MSLRARLRSSPWTSEQRQLALDLRTHAVEALSTRTQRDLRLGEILQRSLLPPHLPNVAGWAITAHYQTPEGGQVGGDWYDAVMLSDTLTVVVGDVAGHGITAAGTMAQLRNALRAYLLQTTSPSAALRSLNEFATLLLPTAFATAIVACINTRTGHVTVASAGHLVPYLVSEGRQATSSPVETFTTTLCI
jgi:chemotaxis family two-component system sensor kinase Cph1